MVSFWSSFIHPSTRQALPNLRQTEIVISLQVVIIRILSISGTQLQCFLPHLNSLLGLVAHPVPCKMYVYRVVKSKYYHLRDCDLTEKTQVNYNEIDIVTKLRISPISPKCFVILSFERCYIFCLYDIYLIFTWFTWYTWYLHENFNVICNLHIGSKFFVVAKIQLYLPVN